MAYSMIMYVLLISCIYLLFWHWPNNKVKYKNRLRKGNAGLNLISKSIYFVEIKKSTGDIFVLKNI